MYNLNKGLPVHKKFVTLIYINTCRDISLEHSQTSKMEIFAKIVNDNKPFSQKASPQMSNAVPNTLLTIQKRKYKSKTKG